jgi:hypothetical protein
MIMERFIGVVSVVALLVAVAPAMAADVVHAFSQLPTQERAALTPLPDDQLASIEGADGIFIVMPLKPVPPFSAAVSVAIVLQGAEGVFVVTSLKPLNPSLVQAAVATALQQLNLPISSVTNQMNVVRVVQVNPSSGATSVTTALQLNLPVSNVTNQMNVARVVQAQGR